MIQATNLDKVDSAEYRGLSDEEIELVSGAGPDGGTPDGGTSIPDPKSPCNPQPPSRPDGGSSGGWFYLYPLVPCKQN